MPDRACASGRVPSALIGGADGNESENGGGGATNLGWSDENHGCQLAQQSYAGLDSGVAGKTDGVAVGELVLPPVGACRVRA